MPSWLPEVALTGARGVAPLVLLSPAATGVIAGPVAGLLGGLIRAVRAARGPLLP